MNSARVLTQNAKTAIVTGAPQRISAAICRRLAADGFAVVVNFTGERDAAEAQVAQIRASGGRATAVQADVSDADLVEGLFDEAEAAFGGSDVLVNNAGVLMRSTFADAPDDHFDQQVAVNLKGVFNGMREAAKRLRRNGRIISISSIAVGLYQPTYGIHAATKAGVEAMTRVLAKELRERNITVNAVAPWALSLDPLLHEKPTRVVERFRRMAQLERLEQPADIAAVVSFLAGPHGARVNGRVLRANGGII